MKQKKPKDEGREETDLGNDDGNDMNTSERIMLHDGTFYM